jgi:hypothetical protein
LQASIFLSYVWSVRSVLLMQKLRPGNLRCSPWLNQMKRLPYFHLPQANVEQVTVTPWQRNRNVLNVPELATF